MKLENLPARVQGVIDEIDRRARRCGREPGSIELCAASKTRSVAEISLVAAELRRAGRPALFGENYVQEAAGKRAALEGQVKLHMIGHLQRNKVREALQVFDSIQSIDSAELLHVVQREALRSGRRVPVWLQVNISRDSGKGGFVPDDVGAVAQRMANEDTALELIGLMTITRHYDTGEEVRPDYRAMRALRDAINPQLKLSMGMSEDYGIAIEEGADLVRVGTALFGDRLSGETQ